MGSKRALDLIAINNIYLLENNKYGKQVRGPQKAKINIYEIEKNNLKTIPKKERLTKPRAGFENTVKMDGSEIKGEMQTRHG